MWASSEDLAREAAEILERRCFSCHGEDAKAGLRLHDRANWGDDLVVPGKLGDSRLWIMVSGQGREIMPPSGKLPKRELQILRRWIVSGAPEKKNERKPGGDSAQ